MLTQDVRRGWNWTRNRPSRGHYCVRICNMLSDLFLLRGVPEHIRSDNDSEFVAKAVQERITAVGATTAYIRPPLRAHSTSAKLRLARMIG